MKDYYLNHKDDINKFIKGPEDQVKSLRKKLNTEFMELLKNEKAQSDMKFEKYEEMEKKLLKLDNLGRGISGIVYHFIDRDTKKDYAIK